MNGENWPLVTAEPVEFEKYPFEVQEFKENNMNPMKLTSNQQ